MRSRAVFKENKWLLGVPLQGLLLKGGISKIVFLATANLNGIVGQEEVLKAENQEKPMTAMV